MILLDDLTEFEPSLRPYFEDTRKVRVHPDVKDLAFGLAIEQAKLKAASDFIFMPSYRTWIEWEDQTGKMGFYFDGYDRSVTRGLGVWASKRHVDPEPVCITCDFDINNYELRFLPNYAEKFGLPPLAVRPDVKMSVDQRQHLQSSLDVLKPVIWAILALINSPKIIREHVVDQAKINKRRAALGRYTFHPYHEVRLDIDKRMIKTVAGHGDGASRALHFVRTHIRFRRGQYELVRPHWRGDPALGIRDTHYRVDRRNSKWPK